MTEPTRPLDSAETHPPAITLSGSHDTDANEYTIYPAAAGDEDLVTTWLTVDASTLNDLDDWR